MIRPALKPNAAPADVAKKARRQRLLEEAWIGDAVLALYARRRILRENGAIDAERFARMTSNQFLAGLGDPAEVEAGIGRAYEREGLDAAFRWIESQITPLHERQEAKRDRKQNLTKPAHRLS